MNIESLNIDGVTVNDPIVLASALNEFFSKVAIQIAEDIHPVSPHQYDDDAHDGHHHHPVFLPSNYSTIQSSFYLVMQKF